MNTTLLAFAIVVAVGCAFALGWTLARRWRPARRHLAMTSAGDPKQWPFSAAVEVGETMYLAGHLGVVPPGGGTPDPPEVEAEKVLQSMRDTLQRLGMGLDDLVFVQVFCPDVSHFGPFDQAYRRAFGHPMPARAFIGSGPLLFGARFEVQGIAVRR